ncbi:MAG: peptide ABC transporter substrate-binding protein [Anaerolineales bacterium]
MRKLFTLLSFLVLASMVLAACGGAAPAEPQTIVQTVIVEGTPQVVVATPEPETETPVLRVNLGTYPDTIDPQKSSFVNEIAHLNLIYEGLTGLNEKLETIPGAAESWEYNDDLTELTFTLREGLAYSDGSPLNAARFAYSIKRNIDPATAGEYASITDEILNAPEWRTGAHFDGSNACAAADADGLPACTDEEKAALEAGLGVKATHADGADCSAEDVYNDSACNTLKLTFHKPAPYFHTIMGIWVAYPAKEELIAEGGDLWWTSPVFQVGNGPFIWTVGEPFVRGLFVPNPNYKGEGVPAYDLEFRYIADTAVAFEAYKNKELDIIEYGAEDVAAIDADPDLTAQKLLYPGSCTFVVKYGLAGVYTAPDGSTYDSPFKDPLVREAFAYAFDAQGWVDNLEQGLAASTWTWIPPGYPGYKADSPMKFDPELAVQKLAESSYGGPDALNALGMKLTFGDVPRTRARSEYLVANYKEVLDVDIALDPIDPTAFTELTKDSKTFPLLARQGWCADYPDQQNWLSVYWRSSTSFAQRQGYVNPEFDALVDQADVESDLTKRAALYEQAQDLLLTDFPSAFGYNNTNNFLVQPWVKGIVTTPQDSAFPGEVVPWTITIDTAMMP